MTKKQEAYHELNKRNKNLGICSCGKPKPWNEEKGKYEYYCGTPEHKAKLRQNYQNNMVKKHGTDNILNDPEVQRKMMEGRRIAKRYTIGKTDYVVLSQLEYNTLVQLDRLGYRDTDIEAPASFNISYEDPRTKKVSIHIPDVFIKSLNLIISVKDGLDNPNSHPNFQKDRVKSLLEYKAILGDTDYNYVQIEGNNDIKNLRNILSKVKDMHYKKARYLMPPVVDVEMLVRENAEVDNNIPPSLFDMLCINEKEAWLGSNDDSLIGTFVNITESPSIILRHNTEEPNAIHFNLGAMIKEYDLDISLSNIHDTKYPLIEIIKEGIFGDYSKVSNLEFIDSMSRFRMVQSINDHEDIREVINGGKLYE